MILNIYASILYKTIKIYAKLPHFVKPTTLPERPKAQLEHGTSIRFNGEAQTNLLRLSEKSVTGQTATIYSVHKEQCTLYVVYYEAEKHFSDSFVMPFVRALIIDVLFSYVHSG
jgi:hypothetical protein